MSTLSQHRCPHLGLYDDPETWCAFPAPDNYCHRPLTPQRIALSYQISRCLSDEYVQCPVYRAEGKWRGSLPKGIRAKQTRRGPTGMRWGIIAVILLVALVGGGALFLLAGVGVPAPAVVAPSATLLLSATPTTITETLTSLPPTPSSTPTKTPMPLPSPTHSAAATSTTEPTATPEGAVEATLAFDTNLRTGPGIDFDVITVLQGGTNLLILARDQLGTWLFVHTPAGNEGWVFASQVEGEGLDILLLPTAAHIPPLPSPTATTPSAP